MMRANWSKEDREGLEATEHLFGPPCEDCTAKEATLAMTVARLGGFVEEKPTARHNFLQRIDELRQIEARKSEPELFYLLLKAISLLQRSVEHLPKGGIARVHKIGDGVRDFLASDAVEALYSPEDE
ncbi:MAG TPA: hypothetical protein PKE00_11945 [Planctomycetota bacterium]|nr:hypothetical protein [Planctomycetota bacterium]HMR74194.1 hypothetical protein [Polyangiaceae bacterium]